MCRSRYAVATILFLVVEAAIAVWVDDALVRPYLGDSLAVVLVYCGLRAMTPLGVLAATLGALGIAAAIELSQYWHFVDWVGLGASPVARAVLGTGFDPHDFVAYAGGALAVLAVEALVRTHRG